MSPVQRIIQYWLTCSTHYLFAALAASVVLPIFCLVFVPVHHAWVGLGVSLVLAGVVGGAAAHLHSGYLGYLRARAIERRAFDWVVIVNGVFAGEISDAEYLSLRHEAYSDNQLWFRQAICYVSGMFNMLTSVAYVLPVALVWYVIGAALFRPEDLMSIFSAMAHASVTQITSAAEVAIQIGIMAAIIFGIISLCVRGSMPTRIFDDAVKLKVRRVLGITAHGDMILASSASSERNSGAPSWIKEASMAYEEHEARDRRAFAIALHQAPVAPR